MKYHIEVQISVGSNIENKYCIVEFPLDRNKFQEYIRNMISGNDFIHLNSDPDKVNDGKKTSYLIKTDRIYSVNISEK